MALSRWRRAEGGGKIRFHGKPKYESRRATNSESSFGLEKQIEEEFVNSPI